MENVRSISLDMLLAATSSTGAVRSAGRSQAGGLSEADGRKEFVLPDDEPPAGDSAAPTTSARQTRTNRSDAQAQSNDRTRSDDRPRARDPLDAGRDAQAVNPLASASRPEPAQAPVAAPDTVSPPDALKISGTAQQAGQRANGLTGIAAWWQTAQMANQPATGQVQAMNSPAEGPAAAWLQGQANARTAAGESQQAANQAPGATAPVANATGGQRAGANLGPQAPRAPALAGAAGTAGAPKAGAANQVAPVAPIGVEAKPTSPSALPTAATGETAPASQASQAGQVGPASQGRGHEARTQSLSGMAQQGVVSAIGEKSSAEVDPNLQTQAKLIDRSEQSAKSRSASLLEAARPVDAHATVQTSFLAGSQHVDSAAPHGIPGPGELHTAEASHPADQIIENVRRAVANGQREVTINLNPPELGRVRLRMYSEGGEIRGRLDVDNPRTLTEIRHQAELLTQRLAEDGIAIGRLEVHQMSNNGGQTGSSSQQHQDAAGQMPWSHARPTPAEQHRDRASADAGAAGGARTAAADSAGEPLSTGGLNVWM